MIFTDNLKNIYDLTAWKNIYDLTAWKNIYDLKAFIKE